MMKRIVRWLADVLFGHPVRNRQLPAVPVPAPVPTPAEVVLTAWAKATEHNGHVVLTWGSDGRPTYKLLEPAGIGARVTIDTANNPYMVKVDPSVRISNEKLELRSRQEVARFFEKLAEPPQRRCRSCGTARPLLTSAGGSAGEFCPACRDFQGFCDSPAKPADPLPGIPPWRDRYHCSSCGNFWDTEHDPKPAGLACPACHQPDNLPTNR